MNTEPEFYPQNSSVASTISPSRQSELAISDSLIANFRPIHLRSMSANSSLSAPPRLSPKTISLSGSQGFIFSLHASRDKRCSKFIINLSSLFPGMVYDLNSQDALLNLMEYLGVKYFTYLQNKKNFAQYGPIPDFASDLKASGLENETNINNEILKKVLVLIHHGARTINYFGDFNSGRSGMNVTHMESLRSQLTSEEFSRSIEGIKVRFDLGEMTVESNSEQLTETVLFRPFMSGSGGEDVLFVDPIYTPISHEEAKKKYSYNSFIAPFAILKIESLLKEQIKKLSISAPCSPTPLSTNKIDSPTPSPHEMKRSTYPYSFFPVAITADLEINATLHYNNLMIADEDELGEMSIEENPKAPHTSSHKPKSIRTKPLECNASRKKLNFNALFTKLAQLPEAKTEKVPLAITALDLPENNSYTGG